MPQKPSAHSIVSMLIIFLLLLSCSGLVSGDWTMFLRSKDRIPVGSGAIPDKVEVYWKADLSGPSYTSPIVSGGKVYVGSGQGGYDYMECFDANDGSKIWSKEITSTSQSLYGLCSTPCVKDGRLYFGSSDFYAHCLDANTGDEIWSRYLISGVHPEGKWGACTSPVVQNGKVYFGTDQLEGEGDPLNLPNFFCLDAQGNGDGTTNEIWNYSTPQDGFIYSSPAIDANKLVISSCSTTGGELICLDTEGNGDGTTTQYWRFLLSSQSFSTPTIYAGTVYVGNGDFTENNGVYQVNAIPLDSSGEVTALTEEWHYNSETQIAGSIVPYEGSLYFGDLGGVVHCLDPSPSFDKSVSDIWTFETDGQIWATPMISDDRLVIGNHKGDLYCLETKGSGGSTKEIWKLDLSDKEIYSSAAFVGGKLFLSSVASELFCIGEKVSIPPKVVSTTPSNGAIEIDIGSSVVVTFDQIMDVSTLMNSLTISPPLNSDTLLENQSVSFTPSDVFEHSTKYTVTVKNSARSLAGDGLDGDGDGIDEGSPTDDYEFSFTTVAKKNHAPELSKGKVDPISGDESELYTFSVVYTDDDNDKPFYVRITLDGETMSMEPSTEGSSNERDGDFTNGEKYIYETELDADRHGYSFEASDSYEVATTEEWGLKVDEVEEEDDDDVVDEPVNDPVTDEVDDPSEGDPDGNEYTGQFVPSSEGDTNVEVDSSDESTPGFSLVLMVVALFGLVLVVGRRRR